jgi:hypothetical protein
VEESPWARRKVLASICLPSTHSFARASQDWEFEGGMTVSGPSSSRMMRRRDAGEISWYWETPGVEALINFPDAIWRSALICSAAERETGTM